MKQFNLEEYKKNPNRKVITRDGRSVRIVCTDIIGATYPILAICKIDPTHECCKSYMIDGKQFTEGDSGADLFFAPEKKEGWINLYRDEDGRVGVGTVYPIDCEKDARMESKYIKDYVATCKIEWEE